ncbi:MAG: hypothetical protein IR160_07230 [Salinibacterium sp.]|nr:glycerophosphodiester phosphodiesterase family protein [Salinibacterium sp.]MBF0672360.1 hypothetical protein [Salinibacterium sp.]
MTSPSAAPARGVARIAGCLASLPLRSWLLLWLVYVALARAGGPAAGALLEAAVEQAGVSALMPETIGAFLLAPGSWVPTLAALALACAGTLLWTAVVLAVAVSDTPQRALAIIRGWGWRRSLLLVLPLTFLAPLLRVPLFTPVTRDLTLPPFIGREFLKTPHTGALWVLGLAAVALIVFASIVILGRGRDPLRACGRWLRGNWRTALVIVAVALAASLVPASAGIVSDTAMVIGAVTVALCLSSRAPVRKPASSVPALAAFVTVVAVGTGASVVVPFTVADGHEPDDALVIAHRGYVSGGPENTILALEAAAPHAPDYVEVDVLQAADGGIVASHDTNLAVLAGVPGNIYEMTTAEVTATSIEMHGNRDTIPTLHDYALRAKELGLPLMIELKVTGHEVGDFAAQVVDELAAIDALEGNVFHSLDAATVQQLENEHPKLEVGLTIAMLHGDLPSIDCDFFTIEQASITPEVVHAAEERGLPLYAWTVNDENAMRALLDLGVDGLITDNLEADVLRHQVTAD